jgi:hypothetical protein
MNPGSPSHHHSEAEEEDSPLQQSVQGANPVMADLDPKDIMSEAEEEMAGANADDPADKEADGEAEEEGAEDEEEQIPQNLHGYCRNPMLRTLTSKPWKARALWLLRLNLDGGLTSRPRCQSLTPPRL